MRSKPTLTIVVTALVGLVVAVLALFVVLGLPGSTRVAPAAEAALKPEASPTPVFTTAASTASPMPVPTVAPTATPGPEVTPLTGYFSIPPIPLATFTPTPMPPTTTPLPPTPTPDPVASGLVPLPPVKDNERWISFNLNDGVTRLMEGRKIVKELPAAFGYGVAGTESDFYSTAPGQYSVYEKREGLYYDGTYSGLYFMGWVGFDQARANGFHSYLMDAKGTVVDSRLGPVSHGCIRTEDWKAVYEFAQVGMPVIVHGQYSGVPKA